MGDLDIDEESPLGDEESPLGAEEFSYSNPVADLGEDVGAMEADGSAAIEGLQQRAVVTG